MIKRECDARTRERTVRCHMAWCGGLALTISFAISAQQTDLVGPSGSGRFGASVVFLHNGNFVVTDPGFDDAASDVGAIYVYRRNGELVSRLVGSTANDRVGSGRLVALPSGNAVVCSPDWDNGTIVDAGAATFIDADRDVSGTISAANSLVADVANSRVCNAPYFEGLLVLTNGNYVVASETWAGVGAVTWGSGASGVRGVISSDNSLTGATAGDFASAHMVVPLANGNYAVVAASWDGPGMADAGAVAWGDGASGTHGVISAQNALVGGHAGASVGVSVSALRNGNYVALYPGWRHEDAYGAVVWNDGSTGRVGSVTADIALTGTNPYAIPAANVLALANGNYLVMSANAEGEGRGALTWGNGATGTTGVISAANSIVGARPNDSLGDREFDGRNIAALTNGNYVVCSRGIDDVDHADLGACVWGDGSRPTSAVISTANALFGGYEVTALSNGHYVVGGTAWDQSIGSYVGAYAWGNGSIATSGYITSANAMLAVAPTDLYASRALALDNGKYVLMSLNWKDGSTESVGAMTVLDGSGPSVGRVTAMNSRVGSSYGDTVGYFGLALPHGRFVMATPNFSLPSLLQFGVGAVTWVDSNRPVLGRVTQQNALYGTHGKYWLGASTPLLLPNGDYIAQTPLNSMPWVSRGWSFGRGRSPLAGPVDASNSVVSSGAVSQSYDTVTDTLLIGRPSDNRVTLFRPDALFSTRGD